MPKFANVVTIEVALGRRDQVVTLLTAHKARCLKDEPGTLQFEILLPKDQDTKVLSYEVYRGRCRIRGASERPVPGTMARRDCRNGGETSWDAARGRGLAMH
jgi:Antibiotic biosynthesis monooxygenase